MKVEEEQRILKVDQKRTQSVRPITHKVDSVLLKNHSLYLLVLLTFKLRNDNIPPH